MMEEMDENAWEWMTLDEIDASEWKWMKMNKDGWKSMMVDDKLALIMDYGRWND